MIISKTIEWDMGHRIPNHKSKCRNLHGHRYKIEVFVNGELINTKGSSSEGMVIDFGDLKKVMMDVIDKNLDHGFMMYCKDSYFGEFNNYKMRDKQKIIFVTFIPTAENIARYIYEQLAPKLKLKGIEIKKVILWETPTSTAIYEKTN